MKTQTKRRVLVVDNDEDVLSCLGKGLSEAGYETTTTWSGVEALSLLEAGPFDSLLVDDYLPDLYIGEFLQKVSALHVHPKIFVMHLTNPPAFRMDGSPPFRCVRKGNLSKILQALADEESEVGPQTWTH